MIPTQILTVTIVISALLFALMLLGVWLVKREGEVK